MFQPELVQALCDAEGQCQLQQRIRGSPEGRQLLAVQSCKQLLERQHRQLIFAGLQKRKSHPAQKTGLFTLYLNAKACNMLAAARPLCSVGYLVIGHTCDKAAIDNSQRGQGSFDRSNEVPKMHYSTKLSQHTNFAKPLA